MSEEKTQEVPQDTHGKITVTAVVRRKDGTVEDLGVISEGRVGFEASTGPS